MTWTYPGLLAKFRKILIDHGQNAFLRRRCIVCVQSGPFMDYDDNCPSCSGTGYKQVLERYTMRKWVIGAQNSFPQSMQIFESGMKLDEGIYFFMEHEVNPREGDLIYDWNNSTQSWDAYEVGKVLERRWDNRVLFYVAAGEIKVALKP